MIFLIINLFFLFIKAFALMGLDEVNKFICLADNLEYVELQGQDNIVSSFDAYNRRFPSYHTLVLCLGLTKLVNIA